MGGIRTPSDAPTVFLRLLSGPRRTGRGPYEIVVPTGDKRGHVQKPRKLLEALFLDMEWDPESGDYKARIAAALDKATDCLSKAEQATDVTVRQMWRDLAEQWRALAKQIAIGRW